MFFYKTDKQGNITEYAGFTEGESYPSFFITEGYLQTDRKIIKNADGKFVFEDTIDIDKDNQLKAEKAFQEAKHTKIQELKNERDKLEISPITVSGYSFDFDTKAETRISNAIITLRNGGTKDWTLADNSKVRVNQKDLYSVVDAAAKRSQELHDRYGVARDKVNNAKTIEEVNKVTL